MNRTFLVVWIVLPLIWPSCYIGICFFFKGLRTFVSSVYNKTEMLTQISLENRLCTMHTTCTNPRGYFHIRRSGGLAPNFASEILVGATNFAYKIIIDKYPKFCPLNFRYDPKIETFSQLLRFVVTELPKFFHLFGELGWTLPHILPPNLMWGPSPLTSLFGSTPWGKI